MRKAADAFRTISEVAEELDVQKHVLRFWEIKFPQIKPLKRGGGRRYYRPADVELLRGIRAYLHADGYTIKGVQKILRENGVDAVKERGVTAAAEPTKKDGARRLGARTRATGHKPAASPLPADTTAVLEALLAQLQACRTLLAGQPPQEARSSQPRRAAG